MNLKDDAVYRDEVEVSLQIIERELLTILDFPHGWQNIAVQLNKLLCDGTKPLLCRMIESPKFYPMLKPRFKSQLPEERIKYSIYIGWETSFSPERLSYRCFDESKEAIGLDLWLDQVFVEVSSVPISIREFISSPRNKEAAHSDTRFNNLLDAAKIGLTAVVGDKKLEPLPLGLAILGKYVSGHIRNQMGGNVDTLFSL